MSFFQNLFAKGAVERDLDQEVRSYVDLLTEEKIKAGMSPDEARRAARLEAGSVEQIKDEVRDVRKGSFFDTGMQDIRYGLRLLRRSPGFTTLAVLTIGLGIGANSAIFSVINGVVRKPLAYPGADRLMFITSQFPTLNFSKFWISPPEYFDITERSKSFSHVAAYTTGAQNLSEGDRPERVNAAFVTANMFDVLGVRPLRGSVFTAEQDRPGADPVVVVSHELWQRAFGGDPSIVGKAVMIQGRQRTVLGVMPPGFDLHDSKSQLWIPLTLDPTNRQNRGSHFLYLVGRLAPDVTAAQANAELQLMLKQWGQWWPATHVPNDSTHRVQMAPLRDEVVGNVRKALWVLQGAVALVLLIACANVANLLLARAESRHKEFAVRTALGAGKTRILRQFMTEGTVLSLLGAALGLALAFWGLKALLAANPESVPRASEITLDPVVLGFTVGVALLTGLVFGLAPLLHMGDQAVSLSIKEGGQRATAGSGRNRVRRGLVVAEIALAVMLVIGAGLLIKTFRNLTSVDAGFDSENRITFGLVLPQATYPDSQRVVDVISEVSRKLDEIPGVERVSAMQGLPPQRPVNANDTNFEGYSPGPGDPPANVDYYQVVSNGYFKTMGIDITAGRAFEAGDAIGGPVAIINEALAKRFYKDKNPIGRRVNPSFGPNTPMFTIVGVSRDVKQGGLEAPSGTELYFNFEQAPRIAGFAPRQMNLVLEASRPLSALLPSIRSVVSGVDPGLPIIQLRTMDDVVGASLTRQRFLSLLLGIFAVVALLLAAIGTYGVLSYMVSERQREIGIRMALGAGNGQVIGLVLRQGIGIAGVGIAVGVVGALGLSRITRSLLYGVDPVDPATFGTVVAVIALVATAACLIPMRRATRVDPLTAIRAD
ncbi:MAG TPA: ABC transporter permease [Gemmatimonadaceae bacterium]|nr:ABC transporter permease [Gemmatimonadaceae bacterium]